MTRLEEDKNLAESLEDETPSEIIEVEIISEEEK